MDFLLYGSPFMIVAGFIGVTAGVCMLVWQINKARKQKSIAWRWVTVAMMIAALYPIGLGMKITTLGPSFLRWHLSDIGFPVFLGLVILFHTFWGAYLRGDSEYGPIPRAERIGLYAKYRQRMLLVTLALSYIYECGVGLIYAFTGRAPFQIGNFDWLDMLFYTLGAGAAYFCHVPLRRAAARLVESDRADAEAERQAAAARTSARTPPPARRPKKRRR